MTETGSDQQAFGWVRPGSEPVQASESGSPAGSAAASSPSTRSRRRPSPRAACVVAAEANAAAPSPAALLPPDSELWDVHAAARFLKRSVSWVYHRTEDGTLPVRRIGGWGVRFIPSELRAWVQAGGDRRRR